MRDDLADGGTTDFWVYLRNQADLAAVDAVPDRAAQGELVYERLTATAETSQAGLAAMLDAEGVAHKSFWIANTLKVTGDEELLDRIAAMPEVARVTADRSYELPTPAPAEAQPRVGTIEWGVERINAPRVWDELGATGEDIVVGVIDSGARFDHPALVRQYRGNLGRGEFDHNYNWYEPFSLCLSAFGQPCDADGHGTHVTGTIVGDDSGGNRIGVAPGATWIAAKACDSGSCLTEALLSSGQFMLAPTDLAGENPRPDLRPHIVNNSWGGPPTDDPWYQQMVRSWVAAGIFPVFAAGNNGPGCGTADNPGNLPESYAVGAFDVDEAVADFSGRGPSAFGAEVVKPNLAAPGVAVRSAWSDGGYHTISGTSMAAPHLAGAVALVWSAAPAIRRDVAATRELLDRTAADMGDTSCGGTRARNNVWGEGRLDAWAAVDRSPHPPVGLLEGTVTDVETGKPIAGATIAISGAVNRERTAGSDGTYSILLPAGGYEVTASMFGYADRAAAVTIVADGTATEHFPLSALDSVTVSGRVVDGSGHGWPLYARVAVDGTPAQTFTDPVTGEYHLSVPAQDTYTLRFTAQYPGYAEATEVVEVDDRDLTRDLALAVDNCLRAPGYRFGARVGLLGDSGGHLAAFLASHAIPSTQYRWQDDPADFDVIVVNRPDIPGRQDFLNFLDATDAAGTGVVFLDTAPFLGGASGIHLLWRLTRTPSLRLSRADNTIPYLFYEAVEEHPILDGFEVGQEIVFDEDSAIKGHAWFDGYEGDGRRVIAMAGRSDRGPLGSGIGVQEREHNRHVLLSMHGASSNGTTGPAHWTSGAARLFRNALTWAAPDATFDCSVVAGGLLAGEVTDHNTGDAVNQAVVTGPGDVKGVSAATPDDRALDDGFYWLFAPAAGAVELTASAHRYASATRRATIVADATTWIDVRLPAGALTATPAQVRATIRPGQSADRAFTITNTGSAPVELAFAERHAPLAPASVASEHAEVQYIPGEFSPSARPSGDRLRPAGVQSESSSTTGGPWTDIAGYPLPIMDSSATVLNGRVYSIGGLSRDPIPLPQFRSYVYQPVADTWERIADLPVPRQKPEVAAIDELIYVVGGWGRERVPTATTFVYDPADDRWSRASDMPAPRAAPGATVLDGRLYVVGGCGDDFCSGTTSTWRYDPAADEWEQLADYPEPVAWLGCAGLAGRVTCAGGIDGSSSTTTAATYAYDPGANRWIRRADLPYGNWGMAYAQANGQLVVSGGITSSVGRSTVTNRGAVYEPDDDEWSELAPAGRPVYRAAGACGFYKIGGTMDAAGFTPLPGAEVHPGFGDCATNPADVPWLTVEPQTTTLQPGDRVTATISLGGGVELPGTYRSMVRIGHDTPYPVGDVGVTMRVLKPLTCDRTITGLHRGPLRVTAGVTCLADGAMVIGPTTVRDGAGLAAGGASFVGPVTATGAAVVEVVGSKIIGPVAVRGTVGSLRLSDTRVAGPVRLVDNATGEVPIVVAGNRIIGVLSCTGNSPPPVNEAAPNTVTGPRSGQCARL